MWITGAEPGHRRRDRVPSDRSGSPYESASFLLGRARPRRPRVGRVGVAAPAAGSARSSPGSVANFTYDDGFASGETSIDPRRPVAACDHPVRGHAPRGGRRCSASGGRAASGVRTDRGRSNRFDSGEPVLEVTVDGSVGPARVRRWSDRGVDGAARRKRARRRGDAGFVLRHDAGGRVSAVFDDAGRSVGAADHSRRHERRHTPRLRFEPSEAFRQPVAFD